MGGIAGEADALHRLGAGGAAMILAGQPSAIGRGLTHYWGGMGLQWTLRWRGTDLNSGFRAMVTILRLHPVP